MSKRVKCKLEGIQVYHIDNNYYLFPGENYSRPQSEIKASTPVEKPPPPPQSAPPQLTEQAKMDGKPLSTLQ